jgi:phenylacetate-CoA ligase
MVHYLRNQEILAGYRLRNEDLPRTHDFLSVFQPEVLTGYTNLLVAFARYLRDNKLKPNYPKRTVLCSAETLHEQDRAFLASVFQRPVCIFYGARDIGSMAFECIDGRNLHVMAEDVILEPHGKPTDDLGDREILVTKLNCLSMPLIRYRIGDRAVFSGERCTCGLSYPILKQVTGRSSAIVHLPDGGFVSAILFPMLLMELGVTAFQVVQREDYSLVVKLLPDELDERGRAKILRVLGDRCPGLKIDVAEEDLAKLIGKTGKIEPFVSHVGDVN